MIMIPTAITIDIGSPNSKSPTYPGPAPIYPPRSTISASLKISVVGPSGPIAPGVSRASKMSNPNSTSARPAMTRVETRSRSNRAMNVPATAMRAIGSR